MNTTSEKNNTNNCRRCGQCCIQGGPSLHREDLGFVNKGYIRHEQLLCIREGEWSFNPALDNIQPADKEYIKIQGKGASWECFFFSTEEATCTIYDVRPFECRILSCGEPERLIAHIGQNVLGRRDLMNPNDQIRHFIDRQEKECSCWEANRVLDALQREGDRSDLLEEFARLVTVDLHLRQQAHIESGVDKKYEYFLFGRPLFICLQPFGIVTMEKDDRFICSYCPEK